MTFSPVRLLVGSRSDLKPVRDSKMFDVFDGVGLDVSITIVSAHRNARELVEILDGDVDTRIFIAAAGLACALPGAVIAADPLRRPVIGVPLDDYGIDSVLRLPPGTCSLAPGVGKHGLYNAALAAVRIVSIFDEGTRDAYALWSEANTKQVERKVELPEVAS